MKNLKSCQTVKSVFIIYSLVFFMTSLYAGKKFLRIGKYGNVEILKVTARGIQISHSEGMCYITENDLSDMHKKLLSSEIEQYHKLKSARIANVEKLRKQQTEELESLIEKIPQMTAKELQIWSKKRVGVYFNDKKFLTRFYSAFYYANNRVAFQKAFEKRMPEIYNEFLENLSKKLCQKTPEAIDMECRRLFGIKYSDRNFRQKLKKELNYATNFDSFFSRIDKSVKIYNQNRQREAAERRRKQERIREQEKKQSLNSMYQNILQIANNAKSQNTLDDDALRSLMQLKGWGRDIQNRFSLSQAEREFLEALSTAGDWAVLYFNYLRLSKFFSGLHKFDDSEHCLMEAGKARDGAKKMLVVALHAYNAL